MKMQIPPRRVASLAFLLWMAWVLPLVAQGEVDVDGGVPASPNEALTPNGAPGEDIRSGDGATVEPELDQLSADLGSRGFAISGAAFDIFPSAVKAEIQGLMSQLLPVLDSGDQAALDTFFTKEGDRIATVFDQLGLTPNADSLLQMPAVAGGTAIKFPDEFENYEEYLKSLNLEDFERDYMLRSKEIADHYESTIASSLGNRERVQSALETYQTQLESLNERYAEQFRELSVESIERAGADGKRPDIDR